MIGPCCRRSLVTLLPLLPLVAVLPLLLSVEADCPAPVNRSMIFWGERNSGTRWAELLLRRNLELSSIEGDYKSAGPEERRRMRKRKRVGGPWTWKHACAISRKQVDTILANSATPPSPSTTMITDAHSLPLLSLPHRVLNVKSVIFVTLSKNPYAWLGSMFHRPYYHSAANKMSFSKFIQEPYPAQTSATWPKQQHMGAYSSSEFKNADDGNHNDDDFDRSHHNKDLENYWGGCHTHHKGHAESNRLCTVCSISEARQSSTQIGRDRNRAKPAFASPVQMWNIKMQSYLELQNMPVLLHTVHIRYEDLLRSPDSSIEAISQQHCVARRLRVAAYREEHVKGAPNMLLKFSKFRNANYTWHKQDGPGLIGQYVEGGWKSFYRSNLMDRTPKEILSLVNSQLDHEVMEALGYEIWWGAG